MKTTKSKEIKAFHYISDYAKDLLDKIPEEFEVDEKREFKIVTLKELGFTKDWTETKEFLNNDFLATKGLALCNPEDVFAVNKSLKKGEYAYVGMNPIPDRYGYPSVFGVCHSSDGLWLRVFDGRAGSRYDDRSRWAFLASSTNALDTQNSFDTQSLTLEQAIKICKDARLTVTKVY